MDRGDIDVESLWAGLLWGMAILLLLIRLELWLRRPPQTPPPDPFETLRWEVLHSARDVIDGEVIPDAAR